MLGFSGMIDSGRTEITEDRQKPGHALGLSVLANTTDVGRGNVIPGAFVNVRKQPPLVERVLQELQVKTPSGWTEACHLSGGSIMRFNGTFNGLKIKIAGIFPVMLLVILLMPAISPTRC